MEKQHHYGSNLKRNSKVNKLDRESRMAKVLVRKQGIIDRVF